MKLKEQLKKYRNKFKLTQKELAEVLNVSDKTVSSWETGRTYPDISMLVRISDVFNISLDEFIRGDLEMVDKLNNDLKLKNIYKYVLIFITIFFLGGIIFLNVFQYKNQLVDRFNPFLKMEIGYATLPNDVTYNGGKQYNKNSKESQIPDPYENIFVLDNPFGHGTWLTFQGGQAPDEKKYAMVQHKGLYVKEIAFISWDAIPAVYKNKMMKTYQKDIMFFQEGEPRYQ